MPAKKTKRQPKIIIGFDETNNGFHLDDPKKRYHFHKNSQMVIAGCMAQDIINPYYSQKPVPKRKFFNKERDIKMAQKLGKRYISENPDYFYTTIRYLDTKKIGYPLIRANAIALLTFKFFQHDQLDPRRTRLVIDEMNGEDVSASAGCFLQGWLENAKLPVKFEITKKADKKFPVVKTADRIAYYLAAIKFLGKKSHWPYLHRKVSMNQLEHLAAQTQMDQQQI